MVEPLFSSFCFQTLAQPFLESWHCRLQPIHLSVIISVTLLAKRSYIWKITNIRDCQTFSESMSCWGAEIRRFPHLSDRRLLKILNGVKGQMLSLLNWHFIEIHIYLYQSQSRPQVLLSRHPPHLPHLQHLLRILPPLLLPRDMLVHAQR